MATNRVRRLQNLNPVFHKRDKSEDNCELTHELMKQALKSGSLKLSGRGLSAVPDKVWNIAEEVSSSKEVELNLDNLEKNEEEVWWNQKALSNLDLSSNVLTSISKDIAHLYDLTVLDDLSHNKLTTLPGGIGFLVRLTEINCSHNKIKELPDDFSNMRSLYKLDIMNNNLDKLPDDIGLLRKLKFLYAQHNDIKELPDFQGCDALEELHISNNFIKEISPDFCENLRHLKILDLRDNQISELPEDISILQHLVRLDLSNNTITSIPNSLSTLAHLISLQLVGNPIRSIRRDVINSGTQRVLKTLRDRALKEETAVRMEVKPSAASIGDHSVFPDKFKIRKNHCLTVTMKNLTDVPEDVFLSAKEEAANMVDFSKNKLTKIPDGITHLAHCATEIIFSNNQLQSLPTFWNVFVRLARVDMSSNCLCDIPKEFGSLKYLRELNIANNHFTSIPDAVYDLVGLEILIARDNKITKIDATHTGLAALNRLAVLDLANNNIEQVPPILGNLKNITSLDLNGNPFRQPRHQILEKGTLSVMSYLRDRIPAAQ